MKKRNFLILLLLLNQCIQGRIFIKSSEIETDRKTETTFDFPVSCSVYNSVHQVAWLGAGKNLEGKNAEYSISVALHTTIEGSSKHGEIQPIISPRATEKTNLFTNSTVKRFEQEIDNPLHGKACKLMVLYETIPVVVLKDSPSDLYVLSEIFVDDEQKRTGSSSVSRFSFHKKEIIHAIVKHNNLLHVFHSRNEFGQDDTSRLSVIRVTPAQGPKNKNDKPIVYHTLELIASTKIDATNEILMGKKEKPLASFGPEVCGVSYGSSKRLNIALSVTADQGGTACGMFQAEVQEKTTLAQKLATLKSGVARGLVALGVTVPAVPAAPVVPAVPVAPAQKDSDAGDKVAADPTKTKDSKESKKESLDSKGLVDDKAEAAAEDKGEANAAKLPKKPLSFIQQWFENITAEAGNAVKVELPETFEIDEGRLTHEISFTSGVVKEEENNSALPFYVANGGAFVANKLATLSTSTAMSSFVLATDHNVFTLPVDKDGKIFTQGSVQDTYNDHPQFISRSYTKNGTKSLVTSFGVQNKIEDIQVVGDVVYVRDSVHRGVQSYRALLDDIGSIGGWAQTEHLVSDKKLDFFFVSTQLPFTWYGYHEDKNSFFGQAMWETSTKMTDEFVSAVDQALPQESYGVQGLVSLSCNALYEERSMIVATGYEKAVYGFMNNPDGYITSMDSQTVSIPGAGALVTSEVAQNIGELQEWLLLGGVGGLYGYAAADGFGFSVVENIDDLFAADHSWKKIGDFSFVRKIVKDTRNLDWVYLVTNKGLFKLWITQTMFVDPQVEQIFSSSILGGKFDYATDFFIDGDFAVIGTSKGLYVVEDMSDPDCKPYKLELDGTVGSVSQITAVKGSGSFDNLYILSSNHYSQISTVHRVVVKNGTCTLFADCVQSDVKEKTRGVKGSFLDMGTTCSSFFSNGTWSVKMNFPYKKEQDALQCYQSSLRSGLSTIRSANRSCLKNMYLSCVEGSQNIAGMMHDKTLGCWVLFGDFGLRILS